MIAIEANGWMAVYVLVMTVLGTVVVVSVVVAVAFGIALRVRNTRMQAIEMPGARDLLHTV
jgi:hypothetical protein